MYINKLSVRFAFKLGNQSVKKVKKCNLKFYKPVFYCPFLLDYQIFDLGALQNTLKMQYGIKSYRLDSALKNLVKLSRHLQCKKLAFDFVMFVEKDGCLPF